LRYYDEIGLLRPARVGANGYRYYEREQLLRLQQILLLRELGMDLATIGNVVDAERDPVEALRRHRRRLLDEWERLRRLAGTVAATIDPPLSSEQAAAITLPPEELRGWAWCTDEELQDRLPAHMLRRTRAACRARAEGETLYLENGAGSIG
jgi:DNA-binding transcriptional MerR regulator